jgi:CRP-like cAMP-binding protein
VLIKAVSNYSTIETEAILHRNSLFAMLAQESTSELARAARRVDFHKGETVYQVGQNAEALFIVVAGLLKRTSVSYAGQERVLDLIVPGQVFGDTELFAERPYSADCSAVESSVLLCIAGDALRRVVAREPAVSARLIARLAGRQLEIEAELVDHQSKSGNERVIQFLLSESGGIAAASGETEIRLPASKQLIASRIGVTPETFSRALRDLADAGLIVVNGRSVYLQNAQLALHRRTAGEAELPGFGSSSQSYRHGQVRGQVPAKIISHGIGRKPGRIISPLAIINIAGRQRMLLQRMAKSWLMLGRGILPRRAQVMLRQSIALFERQSLVLGDCAGSDEAYEAWCQTKDLWQPYKGLLENVPRESDARRLFSSNEAVLMAADRMTSAYVSPESKHGQLVNLAGRQRMLSQRMAKFYLFQQWGIPANICLRELTATRREFSQALSRLCAAAVDQPRLQAQLDAVTRQWNILQRNLDAASGPDLNANSVRVAASSERLVQQLDAAVSLFEDLAA